jgi:hypothetical protein
MGALLATVAWAALAPAVGAQDGELFTWEMPRRLGSEFDEKGRVKMPRPEDVRDGPWKVQLKVAEPVCSAGAVIRWSVDGNPAEPDREGCRFTQEFTTEGAYSVRLDVTRGADRYTDTQQVVVQDWLIVSLGDSVASGEGVPDLPNARRALWQSQRCHRSARAAPAKAATQIEAGDDHTSVTFVHLACSGATVREGLLGSYAGIEPPKSEPPLSPQVTVLNDLGRRRQVDAVVVSIGANDVYFSDVVKSCLRPHVRDCLDRDFKPEGVKVARPAKDVVADALAELRRNYGALNGAIDPAIQRSRVHLTEYFDPTRDKRGRTCSRILGFITRRDLESARSKLLDPLQREVAEAARAHGWTGVDGIDERYRTHGYCAGGSAWVTTASGAFFRQGGRLAGRTVGTLHPNEAGHDDTAEVLVRSLRATLYPEGTALAPGQRAPAAEPPDGPPPEDGDGLPWWSWLLIVAGVLAAAAGVVWLLALWRNSDRRAPRSTGPLLVGATGLGLIAAGLVPDTPAIAAALTGAGALGVVATPVLLWLDARAQPSLRRPRPDDESGF